jgi:septal ring factor EnvC (AmiA/AmiB activator)
MGGRHRTFFIVPLWALLLPATASAQASDLERQIADSRLRLEAIRSEREQLRDEMEGLVSRARDVSAELQNIERQLSVSRSALAEIDFQVETVTTRVNQTNVELASTRERLRDGRAVLASRLRTIYKMGSLHAVRVLLGADSFTDLLNRYRYLSMIASYDRALVERVSELEQALAAQNRDLLESLSELGRLRDTKQGEVAALRSVEAQREQALEEFRTRERQAQTRLEQLELDETRLTSLIDNLETRRRTGEARGPAAGVPPSNSLGVEDAGRLEWPVDGPILYRFGREQRPNGTILRWNGLGIAATPGEPVRAVRGGTVVMAGPFEGYGPTVVLSHGGGYYTLYLYLEDIGVVQNRTVEQGQVVGTVGGHDTPEGPHIEFQVRAPVNGGAPQAQDPLEWLRPR